MSVEPGSAGAPAKEVKAQSDGAAVKSPKRPHEAPEDLIAKAIAAEDWANAVELLKVHGERVLLDGGVQELAQWLAALPEEHLSRHARVAALEAWVHIYDQHYRRAVTALARADRVLQQLRMAGGQEKGGDAVVLNPFAEAEQSLAAIRLHLRAVTGESIDQQAQVEDIMLPASNDHPMWRAGALVILGRSRYLAGDLKSAADDLEAAHVLATSSRGARAAKVAADAALLLGRVDEARGQLDKAVARYEGVLAESGSLLSARMAAHVGLARVALARLDLETAGKQLDEVKFDEEARKDEVDPIRVVVEGDLARAWWHMLNDRVGEARAVLDRLEKTLASLKLRWPLDLITGTRARFALLKGETSVARRWHQQKAMRRESAQAPASPSAAASAVTASLVHTVLGEPQAALESAERALAFAESRGNVKIGIEARVAMALAHDGLGDDKAARETLKAALDAARAAGGALMSLVARGVDVLSGKLGLEGSEDVAKIVGAIPSLTPVTADKEGAQEGEAEDHEAPADGDA